jgi:hypothetical protein
MIMSTVALYLMSDSILEKKRSIPFDKTEKRGFSQPFFYAVFCIVLHLRFFGYTSE